MKKAIRIWLTTLLVLGAAGVTSAAVCACCAERGHYGTARTAPDKFYLDMLGEIKFAPTAEFYMDAAGFDGVKGLKAMEAEFAGDPEMRFNIAETFSRRTWRLDISTPGGKRGTIALPMPAQMVRYSADTRFDNEPESSNVVLYKEFVFSGTVGGATGLFSSGARATKYELVFQGRGNACDNASDFRYWRLELKGPRTSFAIFGDLRTKAS